MVKVLDENGRVLYHEPPYTKEEEDEFYRRTGGGSLAPVPRAQRNQRRNNSRRQSHPALQSAGQTAEAIVRDDRPQEFREAMTTKSAQEDGVCHDSSSRVGPANTA